MQPELLHQLCILHGAHLAHQRMTEMLQQPSTSIPHQDTLQQYCIEGDNSIDLISSISDEELLQYNSFQEDLVLEQEEYLDLEEACNNEMTDEIEQEQEEEPDLLDEEHLHHNEYNTITDEEDTEHEEEMTISNESSREIVGFASVISKLSKIAVKLKKSPSVYAQFLDQCKSMGKKLLALSIPIKTR